MSELQTNRIIPRSIARDMTGIEWTDFTGNQWGGCTRVPANTGGRSGCDICYAATYSQNRLGMTWGAGAPRRYFSSFQNKVRRLDRLAQSCGMPFSVFSLSLGDLLDPEVDPAWRADLIDTVEACTYLTWLLLTHRPHLAGKLLPASWRSAPPQNVWPGVTIDHPVHGYRWTHHAEYWAHTGRAWISAEPLAASLAANNFTGMATIILGGASSTSDPTWEFRPEWIAEAVDRYGEDKVFFKQFGDFRDGKRIGKKAAGRDLAGRIYDHTPWPRHREILRAAA
jgi:protein gp37